MKRVAEWIRADLALMRHRRLPVGGGGLVSKHRESMYRGGRSPRWIKVKNRRHPAMHLVRESFS